MRRLFILVFCSLVCTCGCSANKAGREGGVSLSETGRLAENLKNVEVLRSFRDKMCKLAVPDDGFSLSYDDSKPPFSGADLLPYGTINVRLNLPSLRPKDDCYLYCPSTG